MSKSIVWILMIALTAAILPAAQDNQNQQMQQNGLNNQQTQQMNGQSSRQTDGQQSQQADRQRNQAQMGTDESGSYVIIDPESVVRFGFDYDGDNQVDAYEYVYGYDLMMVSPRGRQQMQQGRMQQDTPGMRQSQSRDRMRQDRQSQPFAGSRMDEGREQVLNTLNGEIDDLKQVRLSGMRERHVIARVKTDDGQIQAVDLGPRYQVNPLQLQTGDRITVRGVQGSINRRKMLMAMQVRTDDQQIQINRPQGQKELRFAGEVQETTIRSVGQNRPNHLLALVELDNKEQVVVDLGSNSMLNQQNIDISRNDDIVFLAHPAKFAGKNLLSATQLSIDGETYRVGPSGQRSRPFRQQNSNRQGGGM